MPIGGMLATQGEPLYSTGYGGCLAIVLNDPATDSGALAHVFDKLVNENHLHYPDRVVAGLKDVIDRMLSAIGKESRDLECLIWAGPSFTGAIHGTDYTQGIQARGWLRYIDHSRRNSQMIVGYGDVLRYDPRTATCYTGSVQEEKKVEGNVWGINWRNAASKPAAAAASPPPADLFAGLTIHPPPPASSTPASSTPTPAVDLFAGLTIHHHPPANVAPPPAPTPPLDLFAGLTIKI